MSGLQLHVGGTMGVEDSVETPKKAAANQTHANSVLMIAYVCNTRTIIPQVLWFWYIRSCRISMINGSGLHPRLP